MFKPFMAMFTLERFLCMYFNVTIEITLQRKTFLAMVTLIWFLFGMGSDVTTEVAFLSKRFLAIFTFVRFIIGMMIFKMIFEATSRCKAFLAMLTLIIYPFDVSFNMTVEVGHLCKTFMALLTLIGFPFMHLDMTHEITFLSKAFFAMIALIWFLFGMSSQVIFEVTRIGKTSLAVLTLIWFPCSSLFTMVCKGRLVMHSVETI